jgi:hypothetical protein
LFWPLFLTVVFAIYFFGIHPRAHRLAMASQTVRILQQLITADARFAAVRIVRGTQGSVFLAGEVKSEADLADLKRLIEDTPTPRKPGFSVHLHNQPSEQDKLIDKALEEMNKPTLK